MIILILILLFICLLINLNNNIKISVLLLLSIYLSIYKKNINGGENLNIIDKIYFINLDNSKERLKLMLEQEKKHNLNLIRFPAVNGRLLNKDELIKKGEVVINKYNMTLSEIGCAMSGLNLYKKIKKDNDNIVLILEDDIIISDNFKSNLNKYYKEFPEDWDIISLSGNNIYGEKISEHILKPIYNKNHMNHTNTGAQALLINKKGINKLISMMKVIDTPLDMVMSENCVENKINIYYIIPSLILLNLNLHSDIWYNESNRKIFYPSSINNITITNGDKIKQNVDLI